MVDGFCVEPTCAPGEHCVECKPATGECLLREDGYELTNRECKEKTCGDLAAKVLLGGTHYCITKYNIGDIAGLDLPASGITVVNAGLGCNSSETQFCCFSGTTSTKCNSNNGSYSGCGRTVCD